MYRVLIWCASALVLSALVIGAVASASQSSPNSQPLPVAAPPPEPVAAPVAETPAPKPEIKPAPEPNPLLATYIENTMLSWTQLPDCSTEGKTDKQAAVITARCAAWEKIEMETLEHTRSRFHSIANDVAQAAAIESSPYTNDALNAHMSEFVLSLAFEESRFREYVDDGRCNNMAWQKTPEGRHLTAIGGTCDGQGKMKIALATSMWQIHADNGIELLEPVKGVGRDTWNLSFTDMSKSKDLLAESALLAPGLGSIATRENIRGTNNRLLAARTAWHLLRGALRYGKFQNIRSYTGEWGGTCPKSDVRVAFADHWWKSHPFTLPKE